MVYEEVRSALAAQFEISEDDISPETDILNDLGADSLDVVELLMSLEETYGIVITDESASDIRTVNDVTLFIEKLLDNMNS
jgi:acyl carrier protein